MSVRTAGTAKPQRRNGLLDFRAMSGGQEWDPERYDRNARFVSDLGMPVVDLLAPQAGERILDLGCGDGPLTAKLRAFGCEVVGVDGSAEFVEAARARGLDARVMDAQALVFDAEFDAVFSNAAMHWMKRQDDVMSGVARALRPGGRFVAEHGGAGNVAAIVAALCAELGARGIACDEYNPWIFPGVEDQRARLERHDFGVESIELIPRPTPLPGDMVGWLQTFCGSFALALADAER